MSLLTIVQDACVDIGWPKPSTVVGNNEVLQFLRLLNREGEALSRYPWSFLKEEATFTLATSDQDYAVEADFRYLVPNSMWNRDNKRAVIEPLTSEEWQFFKGWSTVNGLNLRARIRNKQIEFEQTIVAADNGKTIAYEYISKYWSETSGGTAKQQMTLDTDVGKLDEELLTLGLIWRFRKAKGLEYQSDMMEYNYHVKQAKARDGGIRKIRMGPNVKQFLGVNTAEGNYGS